MLNLVRPLMNILPTTLVGARNVLVDQVRYNCRWYFERCSEVKRIRKFGYKTKIKTHNGKVVMMRRILKGRHVLTH